MALLPRPRPAWPRIFIRAAAERTVRYALYFLQLSTGRGFLRRWRPPRRKQAIPLRLSFAPRRRLQRHVERSTPPPIAPNIRRLARRSRHEVAISPAGDMFTRAAPHSPHQTYRRSAVQAAAALLRISVRYAFEAPRYAFASHALHFAAAGRATHGRRAYAFAAEVTSRGCFRLLSAELMSLRTEDRPTIDIYTFHRCRWRRYDKQQRHYVIALSAQPGFSTARDAARRRYFFRLFSASLCQVPPRRHRPGCSSRPSATRYCSTAASHNRRLPRHGAALRSATLPMFACRRAWRSSAARHAIRASRNSTYQARQTMPARNAADGGA